ncbi:MAG TPA: VOC family protein, partial [Pyrinomonadaceae bacterium]|nr:VOC family protein [Pyrinomonadaceae bacterium]
MTEAKMQESVQYKPGTFCWIELGTTDGPAAKKFYAELFNWDTEDNDTGPGGIYTILKQNGKAVGGLYQLTPDMTSAGVPPHWMSYASVTNADEAAAKAKSL